MEFLVRVFLGGWGGGVDKALGFKIPSFYNLRLCPALADSADLLSVKDQAKQLSSIDCDFAHRKA
jgi:hypothetical protein